jgi:hypothetical protein
LSEYFPTVNLIFVMFWGYLKVKYYFTNTGDGQPGYLSCIALATGCLSSSPGRGWGFFSLPPLPDRLLGPTSLLPNGYPGLFPWGCEANLSHLSRAEVIDILPHLKYALMAWYSVKAQWRYLNLYLLWISFQCRHYILLDVFSILKSSSL